MTSPPPVEHNARMEISLANVSPIDAATIKSFLALFTDPLRQPHLEALRSGALTLSLGPRGDVRLRPTYRYN